MFLRPTVLFVAEEQDASRLFRQCFERYCRVVTASSGAEALQVLAEQQIDVLVADQQMRGISGLQLLQAARDKGPVYLAILLVDSANAPEVVSAIDRGEVFRLIPKPWDARDLLNSIRQGSELAQLRRDKDQLVRQLRKRIDALSVMYEVSRQSALDLPTYEAIIERVLEAISRVLKHDCSAALISLNENRSAQLRIRCQGGVGDRALLWIKETVLADYRHQAGFPLSEDRLITRVTGTPREEGATGSNFPSQLSVSLVCSGHFMGRLSLFSSDTNAYSEEDWELLDALANQTTDAIQSLRKAEDEAERRIELMVESMNDGVLLTDEKNEVAIINPAARELLQLGNDDQAPLPDRLGKVLGVDLFDLAKAWELGERTVLRKQIPLHDRVVNSTFSPVLDQWAMLRGMVIVLRDVTEEKRLDERKEEFVSIISHELRTPMTSISGALDLVLNVLSGSMNPRQRRYLALAKDSADRLNGTVDDLLDLSKFAKGRLKMSFAPTVLDELIRAALDKYDAALTERRAQVLVDLPPQALTLVADPHRLGQVFNNLITNALKFMQEGGQIRIAACASTDAPEHACVSFWNSGESIPESDLERIFDKFEQVRSIRTKKMRGTGLGLAICRSIVECHGGRIWAEPCADGGQFLLMLPLQPPSDIPEAVPAALSQTGVERKRILLVDKTWARACVAKALLTSSGYEVSLTSSAASALERIGNSGPRPDLLAIPATEIASATELRSVNIPILSLEAPIRAERLLLAAQEVLENARASTPPVPARAVGMTPLSDPTLRSVAGFEDLREKAIERELRLRAASNRAFAFCSLSLRNLRGYNDHYGFAKTSGLIRQTGDLLNEIIRRFGSGDDFLGHVPGDDFVFITTEDSVDAICYRAIAAFDRIIPLYYDKEDRVRGYIEAKTLSGDSQRYPLPSASIVAVLCEADSMDRKKLAHQTAELRQRAKKLTGSVYLRSDREQAVRSIAVA